MRVLWAMTLLVAAGCFSKPEPFTLGDGGPVDARLDSALDAPKPACGWPSLTGALVYLSFDEGNGTIATDSSSNGNFGDLTGATWATGRVNSAVQITGNQLVDLRSAAILDNIGAMTVCAWVNLDASPSVAATIADKSSNGYVGGWNMYVQAQAGNRLGFLTNEGFHIYGSSEVVVGTWTHVCASWDGSTGESGIKLYRNGEPDPREGSGTPTMPTSTTDDLEKLVLGRATNQNAFHLDGKLDEFFLFERVLSLAEIRSVHACAP